MAAEQVIRAAFQSQQATDALYPPDQSLRWLRWLAEQMEHREQMTFHIEELQPDWAGERKQQYQILMTLVTGPITGAIYCLVPAILLGTAAGLSFGALLGSEDGLLFGIFGGVSSGLIFGLSAGSSIGATVGLVYGLLIQNDPIEVPDISGWSWREALRYWYWKLAGGLAIGFAAQWLIDLKQWMIFGLSLSLIVAIQDGIIARPTLDRNHPNQPMRRAYGHILASSLVYGLLGGIPVGLAGLTFFGPGAGLLAGLLAGLAVGLIFGLLTYNPKSVIQHITLRFVLTSAGHMPVNYSRFLLYCEKIGLLRHKNGGFAFVNDDLRTYIAELSDSDIRGLVQLSAV